MKRNINKQTNLAIIKLYFAKVTLQLGFELFRIYVYTAKFNSTLNFLIKF